MNIFISVALLAFAGVFKVGDATVTWTTPSGGTGTASLAENNAAGAAVETIAATTDATPLGDFTLVTTGSPFSLAVGGALTVTAANTLDHETTPTYTLLIQGVDASTTSTATLTVSVTDANDDPMFSASSSGLCIADASSAGTTLTTVTATDQDADTITYSITAAGNTNSDFSIASTGVITVATGKTLAAATTAGYAMEVEAHDGNSATATTTLFVLVQSCTSGSGALLASSVIVLLMSFITLLK